MSTTEPKQPERSLSELISSMTTDVSTLFRKEIELAKEEIRGEVKQAGRAGQGFAGAATSGLYAGFALVLTLGFLLDEWMPTWAGFLIVTVALGVVAVVLAQKGRAQMQQIDLRPEQTIATLKEDAQWLSEQRN